MSKKIITYLISICTAFVGGVSGEETYARTSGIVDRNRDIDSLLKEALDTFGLQLFRSEVDTYRVFRSRLFKNEKLAASFRDVDKKGIALVLEHQFRVRGGVITIDVNASDDAIIRFLETKLSKARADKTARDTLRNEAYSFGITLMSWEEGEYKKIRHRLLANTQLASVFREASREGIMLELGHSFEVSGKRATINVDATDKEIVVFLLGD